LAARRNRAELSARGKDRAKEQIMGLGGSIALIALGLILAFAVNVTLAGLDIHLIGLILAGVGILWLVIYFVLWAPRRRAVTASRTVQRDGYVEPPAGQYVEEQRRVYDDPL
jgi:hypothetical protein